VHLIIRHEHLVITAPLSVPGVSEGLYGATRTGDDRDAVPRSSSEIAVTEDCLRDVRSSIRGIRQTPQRHVQSCNEERFDEWVEPWPDDVVTVDPNGIAEGKDAASKAA
jgi:hypothetical protein